MRLACTRAGKLHAASAWPVVTTLGKRRARPGHEAGFSNRARPRRRAGAARRAAVTEPPAAASTAWPAAVSHSLVGPSAGIEVRLAPGDQAELQRRGDRPPLLYTVAVEELRGGRVEVGLAGEGGSDALGSGTRVRMRRQPAIGEAFGLRVGSQRRIGGLVRAQASHRSRRAREHRSDPNAGRRSSIKPMLMVNSRRVP